MADTLDDFLKLMQRIRAGDQNAARELYERYGCHILLAIRRRLHQPLRTRFDSTDFAQSVWTSFFADTARARNFESPEALIGYLEKMAFHKVAAAHRRGTRTVKHNLRRECSLQSADPDSDTIPLQDELAGPCPTPSQEAVARESWERLMNGQPLIVRRVLSLRRDGHTIEAIARMFDVSPKTIQRLLRRVDEGLSHE